MQVKIVQWLDQVNKWRQLRHTNNLSINYFCIAYYFYSFFFLYRSAVRVSDISPCVFFSRSLYAQLKNMFCVVIDHVLVVVNEWKKKLANNIHCHSNSHKVISESRSSFIAARWWKHDRSDRRELTKTLYAMKYWPEQRALFIERVYCFNWNKFVWHPVACATLNFCLRAPNQIWVLFLHTKRLKSANQMDYCLLSDLDVYVHICAYNT